MILYIRRRTVFGYCCTGVAGCGTGSVGTGATGTCGAASCAGGWFCPMISIPVFLIVIPTAERSWTVLLIFAILTALSPMPATAPS